MLPIVKVKVGVEVVVVVVDLKLFDVKTTEGVT